MVQLEDYTLEHHRNPLQEYIGRDNNPIRLSMHIEEREERHLDRSHVLTRIVR